MGMMLHRIGILDQEADSGDDSIFAASFESYAITGPSSTEVTASSLEAYAITGPSSKEVTALALEVYTIVGV